MLKGVLILKPDGTKYEVEFRLIAYENFKREPVTGTLVPGKRSFWLTVDSEDGLPIPDGDYELHMRVHHVVKSGREWTVSSIA